MIYISTGGFKNQCPYEVSKSLINQGVTEIELSGGTFSHNLLQKLKKLKHEANFQVHNYFPPPKEPFVFNLASLNGEIKQKSIDHAIKAMQWSVELDNPVYSFHAGFLIDPNVSELGKRIRKRKINNRAEGLNCFIENIELLIKTAESLGVSLLIENNVLSKNNFLEFKTNPLLMVEKHEIKKVMELFDNKNLNLLIDVAHLKVSSKSLKFDPVELLDSCSKWIMAYHISDNDGTSDSNDPISDDSWFWNYLNKDKDYYSLEVYTQHIEVLKSQLALAQLKISDY